MDNLQAAESGYCRFYLFYQEGVTWWVPPPPAASKYVTHAFDNVSWRDRHVIYNFNCLHVAVLVGCSSLSTRARLEATILLPCTVDCSCLYQWDEFWFLISHFPYVGAWSPKILSVLFQNALQIHCGIRRSSIGWSNASQKIHEGKIALGSTNGWVLLKTRLGGRLGVDTTKQGWTITVHFGIHIQIHEQWSRIWVPPYDSTPHTRNKRWHLKGKVWLPTGR